MKLQQSFDVAAPIDRVWRALIDVERVAPCLPGASVSGRNDDGSYAGNLTIKIGPTTAAYSGRLEMEQIDEATRIATMQANGTDKRGQGGAKATITSKLSETPNGTHVEVATDYHITGRLARFGRGGMIEDISNRLLRDFAACLQASVGTEPEVGDPGADPEPDPEPAAAGPVAEPGAGGPIGEPEPPAAATPGTGANPISAAPPETSNAVEGIPLLTSVLWERARRNPVPLALIFGFLVGLLTLRRRRR